MYANVIHCWRTPPPVLAWAAFVRLEQRDLLQANGRREGWYKLTTAVTCPEPVGVEVAHRLARVTRNGTGSDDRPWRVPSSNCLEGLDAVAHMLKHGSAANTAMAKSDALEGMT